MFKLKTQEKVCDSLEISAGFGVIGAVMVSATTFVGEVLDQAGAVDSFPGSTGAKYAGILALYAAGALTGKTLLEK